MTLIVALRCTDGVVMAADSASSDATSGTKQPSLKLRRVQERPIIYGGSGDVGLLQKIAEALPNVTTSAGTFRSLRGFIKKEVVKELRESNEDHVPYPHSVYQRPPDAALLFGIIFAEKPHILEIDVDGRDTEYDEGLGFFAAIGSGKFLAQALFRPHLGTSYNMATGKALTYRILDDSIAMAAGGLGHPIHLWTLAVAGQLNMVGGTELNKLSLVCESWRENERASLGATLAGRSPDDEPLPIPPPEDTA